MENEVRQYIEDWEKKCYKAGIPDEVILGLSNRVPNYKTIALCILSNDLSKIGVKKPVSKYYSILKRIEIENRVYAGKQLKLKF